MTIPTFLGENSLTVVVGTRPRNIPRSHPHFSEIVALVQDPDVDEAYLLDLLDPLNPIRDLVIDGSSIEVHETTVTRNGEQLRPYLQRRILDTVKAGLSIEPWRLFVEREASNPSLTSRTELALFMEKSSLPMTPEGKFLAYKRVNADYTDTYTGKIDNSVGQVVAMPGGRRNVDDDRERTCSHGLHFCSQAYLKNFHANRGHIMILEIDPADVVSIPSDYQNTKGRCWRYKVVGEVPLATEREEIEWGIVSDKYYEFGGSESTRALQVQLEDLNAMFYNAVLDDDELFADELAQEIEDLTELIWVREADLAELNWVREADRIIWGGFDHGDEEEAEDDLDYDDDMLGYSEDDEDEGELLEDASSETVADSQGVTDSGGASVSGGGPATPLTQDELPPPPRPWVYKEKDELPPAPYPTKPDSFPRFMRKMFGR